MPVEFKCGCGKMLQVPDEAAGKTVECPSCGRKTQVPMSEAGQKIAVVCGCGKTFRAPAEMAGHSVYCPNCGGLLTIPEISYGAGDGGDTFQVGGAPPGGGGITYDVGERECPTCGALARADMQFCVECGTNLETGERAEDIAEEESGDKPKAKWQPVALALGIFGFSLGLALVIFIATRD